MVAANQTYTRTDGEVEDCRLGENEEIDESYIFTLQLSITHVSEVAESEAGDEDY